VSDSSSLRVADVDRELLARELREHMLAGRLSAEEFEQRLGRAYAAATRGELDAVKADLPMSPLALTTALAERTSTLRRRLAQEAGGGVAISALCVAVWAAGAGHHGHGAFWPAWVIAVMLLPLLRNAWRLLGPAPDLESVEAHLNSRRAKRLTRERHSHRHQRGLER